MIERKLRHLYERLGPRYTRVFLAIQGPANIMVVLVTIALLASFYNPSLEEVAIVTVIASVFTVAGVAYAIARSRWMLQQLVDWRMKPDRTPADAVVAWEAATSYPTRSWRRDSWRVTAIAVLPSVIGMVLVLDLSWAAIPVLVGACLIAAGYATVLSYSIAEFLMRPLLDDINDELPDDFDFKRGGLPVRKRHVIALPVFTALTGLVVAALVTDGGGTDMLALSVVASVGVGVVLSHELTVLLAKAITDPISRLSDALARVRAGDYGVRVPVISGDELGELSDDFNQMVAGLAERERIRDAFGTYLDKEVAGFILSGQFPVGGVEIDVSIMFCDVRDFTPFAERAEPAEVVAALNAMFETIVPIVDRHGGHVDKFMGDGLLATFGAPEGYADHADRAVAAGLEIVDAVNNGGGGLRLAVGINSGPVVAGSIGGAGRLNFSIIGDAVNTAARVEAFTRETGDDILITAATRDALERPLPLISRGEITLKGKTDACEVLAPPARVPSEARTDVHAS